MACILVHINDALAELVNDIFTSANFNFTPLPFQKSPFFDRYDVSLQEDYLGDGSFSFCRRCTLKETGQDFAVKIISRRVDCSSEIELLSRCQGHPNVVKLIEVIQVRIVYWSNMY